MDIKNKMVTKDFKWEMNSTITDLYDYESVIDTTHIHKQKKRELTIGFNIDDVIRDTSKRIYWFYVKDYLSKYGVEPKLEYEDIDLGNIMSSLGFKPNGVKETDVEEVYNEVIDISESDYVDQVSEYEKFIQDNYLDIFGNTKEVYKGASVDLNNLFQILIENGLKPIIVQREGGIVRNATFLFLSDKGISVDQIIFVKKYEEAFEHCNILVTANPNFLNVETGKTKIKLKTHYNTDIKADYEIDTIKDIFDLVGKLK